MFKQNLFVFVIAATLCGCQTPAQTPSTFAERRTPYTLNDTDRAAMLEGFRASVRDPNSVMLGDAKATITAGGVVTVCGQVNGKNGYGGYTGFRPYLGVLGTQDGRRIFSVVSIAEGGTHPEAVAMVCAKNGIS